MSPAGGATRRLSVVLVCACVCLPRVPGFPHIGLHDFRRVMTTSDKYKRVGETFHLGQGSLCKNITTAARRITSQARGWRKYDESLRRYNAEAADRGLRHASDGQSEGRQGGGRCPRCVLNKMPCPAFSARACHISGGRMELKNTHLHYITMRYFFYSSYRSICREKFAVSVVPARFTVRQTHLGISRPTEFSVLRKG